MLTALAFADFSSELLLKEQMIIPLNSAGHIDATLIDFSEICQKNPAKSAVFYWLFLGEVSPQNFPWNRPIFFRICPENPSKFDFFPLKSREIGRFSANFDFSPAKSADLWANFDFFPTKISRNRPIFPQICPWKSREILRFFPRNIRSPVQIWKEVWILKVRYETRACKQHFLVWNMVRTWRTGDTHKKLTSLGVNGYILT